MRKSRIILRIFNQRTGRRFDLSRHRQTRQSAGASSLDRWKSNSLNSKTRHIPYLSFSWRELFSGELNKLLVSKINFSYHLNLTVPISKVEENMKRAEHRDAVLKQKFYFRTNPDEETPKITELSCDEVINGGRGFFGLIPYMKKYLDDSGTDIKTRCKILVSVYSIFGRMNEHKYCVTSSQKVLGELFFPPFFLFFFDFEEFLFFFELVVFAFCRFCAGTSSICSFSSSFESSS